MRTTKNSTKDGESSDDSNAHHLDVIREDDKGDELPEVTGSRTPFRNNRGIEPFQQLGIAFDPGLLENLENFTPRQETFLTTLLEGTTSRLIDAHQIAVKGQQDEIERLQTTMRIMQERMNETRSLTSMETPRAIRPQDVAYQSMLTTAKKLKEEKRQQDDVQTHIGNDYGYGDNGMAGTMQKFLANMGTLLKNNNKPKDSVTELPKFQGADT